MSEIEKQLRLSDLKKGDESLVIIPSEFSSFVLLVINCLIIFC